MNLLRPPLLRAGSLDANRLPSRMGNRLVHAEHPTLGQLAPAAAAPAPVDPARRAAAVLECQTLIALHGITEQDLFGR